MIKYMSMQISSTYVAAFVSFLVFALPALGFEVIDEGTLTSAITQLVGVGSILYTFYGRYRAGGIDAFGMRKKAE
jgi:hypothetical protein